MKHTPPLQVALLLPPLVILHGADKTGPDAVADTPSWRRSEVKLKAKGLNYKGQNVIFVNRKPMAPQIYFGSEHSRETWTGLARKSIKEFATLGYEIIQTEMLLKYSLRPDRTFDTLVRALSVADIPGDKRDVNINPRPLGFPFLEENRGYLTGDEATRERIRQRHRSLVLGLLWFHARRLFQHPHGADVDGPRPGHQCRRASRHSAVHHTSCRIHPRPARHPRQTRPGHPPHQTLKPLLS